MRKNKLFIFLLTLILSVSCLSSIAFGHSINIASDDTELNWYFVNRGKDTLPECPKEATGLLSKYDAYYLGDTNEKVVYLTFDEGYENGYTPKILDILRDEKVPAAFFVVKPYIVSNPEIIKRMSDEGHLVCNHSNHHPSMATVTDPEKFKSEFTDVEEAYKEVVGTDMPKFFRPPMGKFSEESLKMTKDLGYSSIFWSFAYVDWYNNQQPTHDFAKNKIYSRTHPGAIVLLHSNSQTNSEILDDVITHWKEEGYTLKSLNNLKK